VSSSAGPLVYRPGGLFIIVARRRYRYEYIYICERVSIKYTEQRGSAGWKDARYRKETIFSFLACLKGSSYLHVRVKRISSPTIFAVLFFGTCARDRYLFIRSGNEDLPFCSATIDTSIG